MALRLLKLHSHFADQMAIRTLARLRLPVFASNARFVAAGATHNSSISTTSATTSESGPVTVPGLNTKKTGGDPESQPDSAYPDWLWKLAKRDVSLYELGKQDEEELEFLQVDSPLEVQACACQHACVH